jgi:diguanylate cyclase
MVGRLDFSARGRTRVWLLTALGTLVCIAVALAFDSYDFEAGGWRWGERPANNIVIPLILAPPFFFFLLSKLRELAIAHHELMNVASTDSLTACLNRRAFSAMVDAYLDRVEKQQAAPEGALLIIDIDHFKTINDSFGHDTGDEALRLIARTIREAVRDVDLVGRMGGEEFGVFLPGVDPARTEAIAERIRTSIQATEFTPAGRRHPISASVGGAVFGHRSSFDELYHVADQRLYAAKRDGRNRIDLIRLPDAAARVAAPLTLH